MIKLLERLVTNVREENKAAAERRSRQAHTILIYNCRLCKGVLEVSADLNLHPADAAYRIRGISACSTLVHSCGSARFGVADFAGISEP